MRTAGYRTPIVIDAPQWGQNIDVLQAAGPALIEVDPDHNILLSVHTWWNDAAGTRVMSELQESVTAGLPLIVGEFAHHSVSGCSKAGFAYQTLMAKAQELSVGWLAWSWGGVKNNDCKDDGPFDMTTAGTFDTLAGWGLEVAVSDPNSIKNTSVRPPSLTMAACP
jgi:mannan endo-1,4-beta-mannosidase